MLRVRPRYPVLPSPCYGTPFLELNRKPFALMSPLKRPEPTSSLGTHSAESALPIQQATAAAPES
jgi:hypothetical protein